MREFAADRYFSCGLVAARVPPQSEAVLPRRDPAGQRPPGSPLATAREAAPSGAAPSGAANRRLRRRPAAAALLQGPPVLRHDHLGQLVGGGLRAALVEGDLAVLD